MSVSTRAVERSFYSLPCAAAIVVLRPGQRGQSRRSGRPALRTGPGTRFWAGHRRPGVGRSRRAVASRRDRAGLHSTGATRGAGPDRGPLLGTHGVRGQPATPGHQVDPWSGQGCSTWLATRWCIAAALGAGCGGARRPRLPAGCGSARSGYPWSANRSTGGGRSGGHPARPASGWAGPAGFGTAKDSSARRAGRRSPARRSNRAMAKLI